MTHASPVRGPERRNPTRVAGRPVPTPSTYEVVARQAGANRRRAAAVVAAMAAVPAVVAGLIATALAGWPVGLPVLVVVGLVTALVLWRSAPRLALGPLTLRPLGEDRRESARLHNLVESLCALGGLPKPRLMLVDEPAPNALVVGMTPSTTTLVVTSGLLAALSRVELEGVVAHELAHIRRGDAVLGAVAAISVGPLSALLPGLGGRAARRLLGDDEPAVDLAAIGLTRFPPALSAGLEKMSAQRLMPGSRRLALLWDIPPAGSVDRVARRVSALREL